MYAVASLVCEPPFSCNGAFGAEGLVTQEQQGWQPDPFGRHQSRYFSAGRPTYLVRDGNVEGSDPVEQIPPQAYPRPVDAGMPPAGYAPTAGYPPPPVMRPPVMVFNPVSARVICQFSKRSFPNTRTWGLPPKVTSTSPAVRW